MPRGTVDGQVVRRRGRGRKRKGEVTAEVLDRGEKVFDLRVQGYTLRDCAKKLSGDKNVSYEMCKNSHDAYVKSVAEPETKVHTLRTIQNFRLEELIQTYYQKAKSGNIEAVNALERLFKRQAALMGLDRPATIDIRVYTPTQDPQQASERMRERLDRVKYPELDRNPPVRFIEGTVESNGH